MTRSRPGVGYRNQIYAVAPVVLLVPVALAFGAAYALSANRISPWLIPGLAVAALAAWLAYWRPHVGVMLGLAFIPARTFGFSSGMTTYLVLAWSIYLALVAHRQWRARAEPGTWPRLGWLVLAYVIVSILSLTQTTDLHSGQGLARNLVTSALLFAAVYWSVTDRVKMVWVLGGFAVGGLFVGLHALADYVSGGHGTFGFVTTGGELIGRVTAGFTQPNELGGFLVVTVPLAILGAVGGVRRWRPIFLFAAVVAAFGVYASVSRGALLALAIVPFVFLRGWRLWVVGPIVVVLIAIATPTVVQERFATLSSSGPEVATRLDIWRVAFHIWESHPVLGVGLGGFKSAYADAHVAGKLFLPQTVFEPPPHAHDVFLQVMAEQGTLGLLAFLAMMGGGISTALRVRLASDPWLRRAGSGLLAALAVFLAHDLFDVTLEDPQTGLFVFALLGLLAAAERMRSGAGQRPPAVEGARYH